MVLKASVTAWHLAVACSLVAAAAPQAASTAPPCTTFQSTVTITISSSEGTVTVNPDRACVAPGGNVRWTTQDGEAWSTEFAGDARSPFAAGRARHAGKVRAFVGDRVRACAVGDASFDASAGGCVFKYKASHVKGGKESTIDPQIVIKPGT